MCFRIGRAGESVAGRARVVDAAGEQALASAVTALFDAKYGWSDGLAIELVPDDPDQERCPT